MYAKQTLAKRNRRAKAIAVNADWTVPEFLPLFVLSKKVKAVVCVIRGSNLHLLAEYVL